MFLLPLFCLWTLSASRAEAEDSPDEYELPPSAPTTLQAGLGLDSPALGITPLSILVGSGSDKAWLGNPLAVPPVYIEQDTTTTGVLLRSYSWDGTLLESQFLPLDNLDSRLLLARNQTKVNAKLADASMGYGAGGGEHIQIDIPFKIRSQTFQRIFGSGRIGMNVTGQIGIRGAYRNEKRKSESASLLNNNRNNFQLEQNQQFTVVGKIGEKVDVHIDQDTERTFDFENSLSITYTGEPEEIIQSLEVGNISMSLPSTRFVNFSEKSSGLFGLKAVTRFGPLQLTGVASSEKNESKKQTAKGDGSSESTLARTPGDWVPNMFFINDYYRDRYRLYDGINFSHLVDPGAKIESFTLYKFKADATDRTRQFLKSPYPGDDPEFEGQLYPLEILRWDESNTSLPYTLDKDMGIIRLNFRPRPNEFVAMSYTTSTPGFFDQGITSPSGLTLGPFYRGDPTPADGVTSVVVLVPQNFSPDSDNGYWDRMLKHVYSVNAQNADENDFALNILQTISGSTGRTSQDGTSYLSIFYLDTEQNSTGVVGKDGKIDLKWLDPDTGELWFPSLEPFGSDEDPSGYSRVLDINADGKVLHNVILTANESQYIGFRDSLVMDPLYNLRTTDITYLDLVNRYSIESTAQVGTEVINLGWNVTNVTVTASGRRLVEGTDYELDEFAGIIRITNPVYTAPNQDIEVTYETPQLFQLRKKTYAGLRAEYDLGNSNFLGASAIYFNEESSERKIRLGNEPIKNLIFDVNTRLKFKPRLMTDAMDALPLVEADAESELAMEAEYAIVLPDPNPSNNPSTGDNSGVAYIDDFESSKQEIPVGLSHNQWFMASMPVDPDLGYRGQIGWWNPRDRVNASDIWPNYQESNREGTSTNIRLFRMHYYPFTLQSQLESGSETALDGSPVERQHSWGGIYYDFRGAYDDLSDKKYLEMTLFVGGDNSGVMHIDLGRISEDVIPNGELDTEDINDDNQTVSTSEDIGLDIMTGPDPAWPLPDAFFGYEASDSTMIEELGERYDYWDINFNGRKEAWEPWSFDDFVRFPEGGVLPEDQPIDKSHGWERNSQDTDQLYPDTEDRNGNRSVELENSYFSYTVPLNPAHPDFDRYAFPNEKGWIYLRIPLTDDNVETVGTPSLTLVNGLRLWFSGNTLPLDVDIAEFNIVGNEWRQAIVEESDTSHYDVTVLNNFDNNQFYYGPPGVEGQKDFLTQEVSREQSLVVQLDNLPFGETAWVKKQFATPQTFSEYRKMRMFLHGGSFVRTELSGAVPGEIDFVDDGTLEFRFRIESAQNSYYEYSKFITAGWNAANNLDVLFTEITGLEAFTAAGKDHEEPDKPVVLSDGGQLRVVGNPSVNQVRNLYFGVKNHGAQPATTEVWFNELRLSDVKKENGSAFRAKVDGKFSDMLNLNVNFEQQDAEFHNVKQRSAGASATFTQKRNFSGDTDLGRLLPPDWNTSISVSGGWSYDYRLPKYFPNDDNEVSRDLHPEWVEDVSTRRNARAAIRKSQSKSWVGKQIVDKVTLSYDVAETVSRNKLIAGDTTVVQGTNFAYTNSIDWKHRLRPLFFLPDWPLIGKYSETELNYFPNKLNLGASTDRTLRDKLDRDGTFQATETYTMARNWATGFAPLTVFGVDISRSYQNNLLFDRNQTTVPADNPDRTSDDRFHEEYQRWLLGSADYFEGDHNINQAVTFRFTPELVGWMSTDFNYSTTYTWRRSLVEPARGVDMGSRGDFRSTLRLKTQDLLRMAMFTDSKTVGEYQNELMERKAARQAERDKQDAERDKRKAERKAAREGAQPYKDGMTPSDPTDTTDPLILPGDDDPDGAPAAGDVLPVTPAMPPDVIQPATPPQGSPVIPPAAAEPARRSLLDQLPDSVKLSSQDSLMLMREQARMDSLIAANRPDIKPDAPKDKPATAPGDTLATDGDDGPNPIVEWLDRLRKRLAVATGGFEDLTISFNRNNSFTDPGQAVLPWSHTVTQRHASLLYQLALSRDTGFDTLGVGNYVVQTQRTFGYDYKLATKVKLIKAVPINLTYDYSFEQGFTNDRESSRRETENGWYVFSNEKLGSTTLEEGDAIGGNPDLIPVPNYSLSLGGLQKLPGLSKVFSSLNLNHNYSGKLETAYAVSSTTRAMVPSRLNFTRNFSPLMGFDFTTEGEWSGTLNLNQNRTLTVNDPDNPGNRGVTFRRSTEVSVSGSKRLKKGLKLPLMKNGLKNDTTVRLEYSRSNTLTLNHVAVNVPGPNDETVRKLVWNTPQVPSTWKLRGSADFEFSRNVRGGFWYEFGASKTGTVADQTSYSEFGMNCTIQIRNTRSGGGSSGSGSSGSGQGNTRQGGSTRN